MVYIRLDIFYNWSNLINITAICNMLAHNILHIDYAAIIIIICTNYAKNCIIIPNDFISKNNLNISDFTISIVLVKMS